MRIVKAALLFVALTVAMTWPQAAHLGTRAIEHQDVYFNMWRLGWFAHALATAPRTVLDGNVFYPERRTLTFSDAMPLEGALATPLLWSGVPPVLVHNVLLLSAIVLSALGIFVLARRLTGSAAAGVTAGIIFAFAPYRFDHYMHMELQWTVWIPWAFVALHNVVERARLREGVLAGGAIALQMLSSIYYGIFLAFVFTLCAVLLVLALARRRLASFGALAAGALVAAVICGIYAVPYLATRQQIGGRAEAQVVQFSAKPKSYQLATPTNLLYGERSARPGRPERRLFPGVLPCLLAVFGLLACRDPRIACIYAVGLAAAFEMSLGFYGYSYPFMYEHVPVFGGLRAPARLGVFVLFFLALLAAYGHRAIEEAVSNRARSLIASGIALILLVEYWVAPLALVPYPNTAPPLYAWLAGQPRGVVLELPAPDPFALPGHDARYGYMSTFHWMPTLNGYSGYYPQSYLARLSALRELPSEHTLARLRGEGLRYLIVHTGAITWEQREQARAIESHPAFRELVRFPEQGGEAIAYAFR